MHRNWVTTTVVTATVVTTAIVTTAVVTVVTATGRYESETPTPWLEHMFTACYMMGSRVNLPGPKLFDI